MDGCMDGCQTDGWMVGYRLLMEERGVGVGLVGRCDRCAAVGVPIPNPVRRFSTRSGTIRRQGTTGEGTGFVTDHVILGRRFSKGKVTAGA